jgi:uncharacterized membrane protein YgcG
VRGDTLQPRLANAVACCSPSRAGPAVALHLKIWVREPLCTHARTHAHPRTRFPPSAPRPAEGVYFAYPPQYEGPRRGRDGNGAAAGGDSKRPRGEGGRDGGGSGGGGGGGSDSAERGGWTRVT